ncbi:hypothetical protein FKW77_005881 [Venturia effusa]|uniref:Ceramidase n=1 Tax=Venturia effusa TaxID=50376 RepID=A0A517LMW7_9PEZI|nr:hypothetical protein FKW77_005881 [Venturia effusa]
MYDLDILNPTSNTIEPTSENPPPYSPGKRQTRPLVYRSLIIWFISSTSLILLLLLFARYGWPGSPDPCTTSKPDNTCWCEAYDSSEIGNPGIRQAVNTWSNLYAIITSFIVMMVVCMDRRKAGNLAYGQNNLLRGSDTYVADLYVFVVLFLGLGSMWFHASLTTWGGILDAISIYAFMAFLLLFSVRRIHPSPTIFWTGYWVSVAFLTIVHAIAQPRFEETSMLLVILTLLVYIVLEAQVWRAGRTQPGNPGFAFWWCAFICGVVAAIFWGLSQTGKVLCDPKSPFQPHGLVWHPLAGVASVFLFFYWRAAEKVMLELGSNS